MTEPTGDARASVPDHLLQPLLEAAADTLRGLEGDDVPLAAPAPARFRSPRPAARARARAQLRRAFEQDERLPRPRPRAVRRAARSRRRSSPSGRTTMPWRPRRGDGVARGSRVARVDVVGVRAAARCRLRPRARRSRSTRSNAATAATYRARSCTTGRSPASKEALRRANDGAPVRRSGRGAHRARSCATSAAPGGHARRTPKRRRRPRTATRKASSRNCGRPRPSWSPSALASDASSSGRAHSKRICARRAPSSPT